jgi:hypothetical protein
MLATILPQAALGATVIVDAKMPAAQPQAAEQQPVAESAPAAPPPDALTFDVQSDPVSAAPPPLSQSDTLIDSYSFASSEKTLYTEPEPQSPTLAYSTEAEPAGAEQRLEMPPAPSADPYADFYYQGAERPADVQIQPESPGAAHGFSLQPPVEAEAVQPEPTVEAHSFQIPRPYEAEEETAAPYYENRLAPPPQEFSPTVAQLEKEPEMHQQGGDFYVVPETQQPAVQNPWQTPEAAPQPFYPPIDEAQSEPSYPQNVAPLYPQAPQAPYPAAADYQLPAPPTGELVNQWDDSMDNYPVLMVQEEKRPLSKTLLALAAIAVLALTIAGYFFVYKPFFGDKPASPTQRAGSNPENTKPSAPATKPNESAQVSPPAPAEAAPANPAPPETKPATPAEAKPEAAEPAGQGKVSLQAASFPNEQGAKEFSEKLIRSGVPAYIAAADIAGKGRWFRVRVGRFTSAAEAEKYADQAKQRAKAAGLTLQLVVCDYGNP